MDQTSSNKASVTPNQNPTDTHNELLGICAGIFRDLKITSYQLGSTLATNCLVSYTGIKDNETVSGRINITPENETNVSIVISYS